MTCAGRLAKPRLRGNPVFTRLHHQAIAQVLHALDGDLLREHACLFGGGTVIAMRYGEYRKSESVDIDFLVSSKTGYRNIRQLAGNGLGALFRDSNLPFASLRDARIDQYGIRSMLEVVVRKIKFQIILEGRSNWSHPGLMTRFVGLLTYPPWT